MLPFCNHLLFVKQLCKNKYKIILRSLMLMMTVFFVSFQMSGVVMADDDVDIQTIMKGKNRYVLKQKKEFKSLVMSMPSISQASPNGFGAYWGDAFVSIAYQEKIRGKDIEDGALSLTMGFGRSDNIGFEFTVSSFSAIQEQFFNPMGVNLKIHSLFPNDYSFAVGVENLLLSNRKDGVLSRYAAISKLVALRDNVKAMFSQLDVTLGVGNGRFLEDSNNTINAFTNIGIHVFENLTLFVDWNGVDVNVGTTIIPFPNVPLVVTPTFQNVSEHQNDRSRFTISMSLAYQ